MNFTHGYPYLVEIEHKVKTKTVSTRALFMPVVSEEVLRLKIDTYCKSKGFKKYSFTILDTL